MKPEAAGASGLCQMTPAAFSVHGNRMLLCMEICKELRYNFGVGSDRQIVKERIEGGANEKAALIFR